MPSLYTLPSQAIKDITTDVEWIGTIRGIMCGLEHTHTKQYVIHNDLKSDNVVLGQMALSIQAVIIGFGIKHAKYQEEVF